MSRSEQRNLAIFVAVIGGLLAGVAVLANYSGILRADAQEQPGVPCASEGKTCAEAATGTGTFAGAYASMESAPAGGCCQGEKPAGTCSHGEDGCGDKPTGSCPEKPAGCSNEEHQGGCCSADVEGAGE